MSYRFVPGVHLHRSAENAVEVDALAATLGGPVGLDAVLDDLNRRGRRALGFRGRAVDRAFTWDRADRTTRDWWPQGVSTSADASDAEDVGGRRVLAVTWYSTVTGEVAYGSRVSFWDLDTRRYRHVLLVVPRLGENGQLGLAPLKVHAGGVVWYGPYLHIAATARGFITCRLDDLVRVTDETASPDRRRLGLAWEADGRHRLASYGYRYLLPVRFRYQAYADDGHQRLRYSFMSLDRGTSPPELVAGEYGLGGQSTRLARFPLDPATALPRVHSEGVSRPVMLDERGVRQMQGVAVAAGRYHVTVSRGPLMPGTVCVGTPGDFRRYRAAVPMGPEDISYWPSTDTLWSVSEHPRRRWVYSMRRSWFDRHRW